MEKLHLGMFIYDEMDVSLGEKKLFDILTQKTRERLRKVPSLEYQLTTAKPKERRKIRRKMRKRNKRFNGGNNGN